MLPPKELSKTSSTTQAGILEITPMVVPYRCLLRRVVSI